MKKPRDKDKQDPSISPTAWIEDQQKDDDVSGGLSLIIGILVLGMLAIVWRAVFR